MDLEAIRFLMKFYWKKARLPEEKQHPHILKHSIAVHLAESWVDIKDLQYYLWHKNINNTTIYFQYTTKQMDSFYNKLKANNELV
jgi:site-specific recombinase XerD